LRFFVERQGLLDMVAQGGSVDSSHGSETDVLRDLADAFQQAMGIIEFRSAGKGEGDSILRRIHHREDAPPHRGRAGPRVR
jgi:hypothetical protein